MDILRNIAQDILLFGGAISIIILFIFILSLLFFVYRIYAKVNLLLDVFDTLKKNIKAMILPIKLIPKIMSIIDEYKISKQNKTIKANKTKIKNIKK